MFKQISNYKDIYKYLKVGNKFILNNETDDKDNVNLLCIVGEYDELFYDIQKYTVDFLKNEYLFSNEMKVESDEEMYTIFNYNNNFIKCTYTKVSTRYMPSYIYDFLENYEFKGIDLINNDSKKIINNCKLKTVFNKILILPLKDDVYMLISLFDNILEHEWKNSKLVYIIHKNYYDCFYDDYETYQIEDINLGDLLNVLKCQFKDNDLFYKFKNIYYVGHILNPIDVKTNINKIKIINETYSNDEKIMNNFFDPVYIDVENDYSLLSYIKEKSCQSSRYIDVISIGKTDKTIINNIEKVERISKTLIDYKNNISKINIFTGEIIKNGYYYVYSDCENVLVKDNSYIDFCYTFLDGYFVDSTDEEEQATRKKIEIIKKLEQNGIN